jgi:hypothetical protein
MNRRLLFLTGHLSGLLMGAALVWMYLSFTPTKSPPGGALPPHSVVLPVTYRVLPHIPNSGQLPDGNFVTSMVSPYYLIPLTDRSTI